jgi:hypothetical protein
MNVDDHLLMLIFAIGYPIYAEVENRRYIREIKAGKQADGVEAHRETMIYQ